MRAIELGLNLLGIAGAGIGAVKAADILQARAEQQIVDTLTLPPAGQVIEQYDPSEILNGGEIDLDGYCKHLGYSGVRLDPTQQNVFGWGCLRSDGTQAGMDLYDACKWQYGGTKPYAEYTDYNDPYSWFCSAGDAGSPAQTQESNWFQPIDYPGTDGDCGAARHPGIDAQGNHFYVIDGINVHAEPDKNSPIIGQNSLEDVNLGDTVCNQGFRWWEYSTPQGEGWVSESGYNRNLSSKGPSMSSTPTPLTPEEKPAEKWCSHELDARDLGGGYFWDRNYVVELRVPFYPGDDAVIYFNDKKLLLKYHGYFDGANRWGVSTFWAFFHWSWQDDNRWRIEFRCTET